MVGKYIWYTALKYFEQLSSWNHSAVPVFHFALSHGASEAKLAMVVDVGC